MISFLDKIKYLLFAFYLKIDFPIGYNKFFKICIGPIIKISFTNQRVKAIIRRIINIKNSFQSFLRARGIPSTRIITTDISINIRSISNRLFLMYRYYLGKTLFALPMVSILESTLMLTFISLKYEYQSFLISFQSMGYFILK